MEVDNRKELKRKEKLKNKVIQSGELNVKEGQRYNVITSGLTKDIESR